MSRIPTTIRRFGAKNMVEIASSDGTKKVLFSYNTPVVVFTGNEYFITTEKFSSTTSKQIGFYMRQETHPNARTPNHLNPDLFATLVKTVPFV